jgi:hypothetical protein
MKAWPPPKSFLNVALEVFVDLGEGFLELLARDFVDLFDGGGGVLDGGDQVFALGFEERVALGGLAVLFERHHVDRAHGFELGAHVAVETDRSGEFVAGDEESGVGHERGARFRVRSGRFRTCIAHRIELGGGGLIVHRGGRGPDRAAGGLLRRSSSISERRARSCSFRIAAGLREPGRRCARLRVGGVLFELFDFGFALQLFGGGGFDLRGESVHALAHFGEEGLDALEHGGGGAVALFERGHAGHVLRAVWADSSRRWRSEVRDS